MSEREPATAVGAESRETEVGSVFVSNYPPYSFWSDDQAENAQAALEAPPASENQLGLYLHIPFCRKRCNFCYFKVFIDKNAAEIERYTDALIREALSYAQRPAIVNRPLKLVYVGGGTPSYISAKHLRALFAGLRDALDFGSVEEVTFECEPGTLTLPKLEAIRDVGVTRLSLGVENFSDEILEENGRAHLSKEIYRVRPWIDQVGFDQLNVDLIAGMIGETFESWKETVEKTIDLDADCITIYQLELPFNTLYSKRLLDGKPIAVADWETKRRWHEWAIERFLSAGFETSSAYTLVKRDRGIRFSYRDSLWHGNDLLGLGLSSFSHISGVHFQNAPSWTEYLASIEKNGHAIHRAYATDPQEQLTRELILQMKLGYVGVEYFRDKFGVDIGERYRMQWGKLESQSMLEIGPEGMRLTRQGLLRVDQLLPEFYAPEHQNARYT